MRMTLVTGGARSGKSAYAQRRAIEVGGDGVTFIATARAGDEEMERRIAAHRAQRPAAWQTIESPRDAAAAVRAARTPVVVLDCLTLLASNALLDNLDGGERGASEAVRGETEAIVEASAGREGALIVVTNEVGLGIVPAGEQGRWFRDALGAANQRLAAAADAVVFMVSGLPTLLKGSEEA